jgi:hypothetical protein
LAGLSHDCTYLYYSARAEGKPCACACGFAGGCLRMR